MGRIQNFILIVDRVGLGHLNNGLGRVKKIGPTSNSVTVCGPENKWSFKPPVFLWLRHCCQPVYYSYKDQKIVLDRNGPV